MALHGLKKAATTIDIHIPVVKRLLHRLPYSFEACEMDHRINPGRRLGEGFLKMPGVADFALHLPQPRRGLMPSELVHTVKLDRAAVAEISEHQQLVAYLQGDSRGMAAYEASSTCNQQLGHGVVHVVATHHPKG